MSATVWKYALVLAVRQSIEMPRGARILAVQRQAGDLALWAEVDPTEPVEPRVFEIVGTGRPIVAPARVYLGTIQMAPYVWHIYEAVP